MPHAGSYRILSTGELEIQTRTGWRIVPGCSCRGIFEYADRVAELAELLQVSTSNTPITALYLEGERFRHLCDRVLELNGIDPDWIRPSDIEWLLFAHKDESGAVHPSPLDRVNAPSEQRHPSAPRSKDAKNDYIAVLAAIAARCGSIDEAVAVAEKVPARLVFGVLQDLNWSAKSPKEKEDAKVKEWEARMRAKSANRPQFKRKGA